MNLKNKMKKFLKQLYYFLTDKCSCGGELDLDSYKKSTCLECGKVQG